MRAKSKPRKKPKKPHPGFPLTPHPSGTWVKKLNGKLHHFGPWGDPQRALKNWERQAPALRRGVVKKDDDGLTLLKLSARWLAEKERDAHSGLITWGHYSQCCRAIALMLKVIGGKTLVEDLGPDHFRDFGRRLEAKFRPRALRRCVRTLVGFFNFAADEDWIERPVKLGKWFKELRNKPNDDAARDKARTPAEVRAIIGHAERRLAELEGMGERSLSPMRQLIAGIWLAVNGGYGAAELAQLPRDAVFLDEAVIDYRRGKTKKEHVVPLMPETVAALRVVMAERADDDLVFRTREGNPWRRESPKTQESGRVTTTNIDNFQQMYGKLLRRKDVNMKRPGSAFYELRHTHAELADAAGDPHAASRIIGHALPGMKDVYIRVTMDRLRAVVDYIRSQLISPPSTSESSSQPSEAAEPARPPASSSPARATQSRSGEPAKRRRASSP